MKMDKMAVIYTGHLPLEGPSKFTKFGLLV
jgi:hypothetical protein